jgi:hypothetical protein
MMNSFSSFLPTLTDQLLSCNTTILCGGLVERRSSAAVAFLCGGLVERRSSAAVAFLIDIFFPAKLKVM